MCFGSGERSMMASPVFRRWLALLLGILALSGCGKRVGTQRNVTEDRLYKIGKAYRLACYRLERGPENVEDLKPDIEGDVPEDLFVSPNDGKNFIIIWGVDVTKLVATRADPFTVIGYEKNGVDGTRYVLRAPLGIVKMTDEEFDKARFPPGHKKEM
jgi:hypothetical protein